MRSPPKLNSPPPKERPPRRLTSPRKEKLQSKRTKRSTIDAPVVEFSKESSAQATLGVPTPISSDSDETFLEELLDKALTKEEAAFLPLTRIQAKRVFSRLQSSESITDTQKNESIKERE